MNHPSVHQERKVALVIGANGVIGRNLIDYLTTLPDWDIIGVSRRGGRIPIGSATWPLICWIKRIREKSWEVCPRLPICFTRLFKTVRPGRSWSRRIWPC